MGVKKVALRKYRGPNLSQKKEGFYENFKKKRRGSRLRHQQNYRRRHKGQPDGGFKKHVNCRANSGNRQIRRGRVRCARQGAFRRGNPRYS